MRTSINFSSDENSVKYRNCDDMLARRLSGNIPSHLKKSDTNYKKFITPGGDSLQYANSSKKNQNLSKVEDELAEKNAKKEHNLQFAEIQTFKDVLKEEEVVWTSKLDDWKKRRRSATLDVWQRKEDRESLVMHQPISSSGLRRRAKTFKEIVEEKRKRDSALFSEDDYSFSSELSSYENSMLNRKHYRGAAGIPNVTIFYQENNNIAAVGDSEYVQPKINGTSVPIVLNPDKSGETQENSRKSILIVSEPKNEVVHSTNNICVTNVPSFLKKNDSESHQSLSETNVIPMSNGGDSIAQFPLNSDNDNGVNGNSAQQQMVVNKRRIWEKVADVQHKQTQHRPTPVDLSSLLKKDAEQSQPNGNTRDLASADIDSQSNDTSFDIPFEQVPKLDLDDVSHEETDILDHKPKIMTANYSLSRFGLSQSKPSSQFDTQHFEPTLKYGNIANMRGSSATLPSRLRISTVEEKIDKIKSQEFQNSPPLDLGSLKSASGFSPRLSPRGGSAGIDALFEDFNISITQRPKCDKGFGFTVRGGDEGRPVVVNTVSPGGAAELSHLCVGDEILSINSVRLSSSLTQDGIVQLIVDSVITGSLLLGIRRYIKPKKGNTPRLYGSPRGFQIDKYNLYSPFNKKKQVSNLGNGETFTNNITFPPPPTFLRTKESTSTSRLPNSSSNIGLDKRLHSAIERKENNSENVRSSLNDRVDLAEKETRKRIEEARAEEQRIAEKLRKIEIAKQEQCRQMDEGKKKYLFAVPSFLRTDKFQYGDNNHRLLEETQGKSLSAENRKHQINIIEYTNENKPVAGSPLS